MAQRRLVTIGQTVAVGAAGALAVYVAYYPSDSIAVENGDALWLAVLATGWVSLVAAVAWPRQQPDVRLGLGWIDIAAVGLATWMMIAAFLNSGHSDLRMGTNEAWWWVTAAAILIAARRTLSSSTARQALLLLIVSVSIGLAVDALHQDWISLPATRASYRADPDAVIKALGMDAPPESSTRMVLENRLMDGGPTATFALANSLAAVLLLGVILVAGGLKLAWTQIGGSAKVGLFGCLLVLLPALIAVRSRAALVATLFGLVMLWMVDRASGKESSPHAPRAENPEPAGGACGDKPNSNRGLQGLIGIVGTGILGLIGLAMFGNPEWFGQAPASLTFRLQYWAATSRMMMDHAWLGAGPGNFQSLYDRYRDASTTEQIADPHNFLLETLASGGPIALVLLLIILAISFKLVLGRQYPSDHPPEKIDAVSSVDHRSLLMGGAVMLSVIWFLGLLTLHSPDIQSHRFAVPVAIGLAWPIRSVFMKLNDRQLDQLCCVGLIAVLVHLSVSGGCTVPGVAFWVWILLASLTRVKYVALAGESPANRSGSAFAIGLLTLLVLTFVSVRPVGQRKWLMSDADASLRRGNVGKSARIISEAVDADRWSSMAPILQSEFLCREIIRQNDRQASRRAYDRCIEVVMDRAGPNPSVFRQLATQRLHLYQVFGKTDDLNIAETFLQTAWQGSPANQWLAAQLAEVANAKQGKEASELAQRARKLSERGNNLERAMHLQLLYIAEPMGQQAASKPVRISAKDRFSALGI